MKHKTIVIFNKIINYANETIQFAEGNSFENFTNDRKTIAACVFNISQIGELVKVLDKDVFQKHNNIYWVGIKGLRNRIVHDYEGIDLDFIWEVIKEDLPKLIEDLEEILNNLESL